MKILDSRLWGGVAISLLVFLFVLIFQFSAMLSSLDKTEKDLNYSLWRSINFPQGQALWQDCLNGGDFYLEKAFLSKESCKLPVQLLALQHDRLKEVNSLFEAYDRHWLEEVRVLAFDQNLPLSLLTEPLLGRIFEIGYNPSELPFNKQKNRRYSTEKDIARGVYTVPGMGLPDVGECKGS